MKINITNQNAGPMPQVPPEPNGVSGEGNAHWVIIKF
jgi:hypothetical protein